MPEPYVWNSFHCRTGGISVRYFICRKAAVILLEDMINLTNEQSTKFEVVEEK